jgi:hypothetical protein
MVINDLVGKEVIWKGNKCPVLQTNIDKTGTTVLQLKAEATEKTKAEPWVSIDEVRADVYFTARPMLFGKLVDAHDGWGKAEWRDADGLLVPFRVDKKTGQLILDKENRPLMTMKIFDVKLDEMSLY